MEAFNNLSGTNKLLIILGVIGIPFCTYVFIQDFTKEDDTADISSNYEADAEPSLLLPSPSDESNSTNDEISKIEVYEETLDKKERAERAAQQVEDPFQKIMDENFFSTETESDQSKDETIQARHEQWLAERETRETDQKSLTTKETKQRVRVTIQESSSKGQEAELAEPEKEEQEFSFYSKGTTEANSESIASDTETIRVLVHNEQIVRNNAPLRIRILEESTVQGVSIPKNSIIWGNVSFGRDRVRVSFTNVDIGGKIIPFSKEAYGKDGMRGIPLSEIPGAEELIRDTRDDRLSDLERRRGVVGEIAGGLDALADNTTEITFRDGYPFYLQ
mgnify:CR=1 FL=1